VKDGTTAVTRCIKHALEKHLGTFAKGPEPPRRFRELVEAFAVASPHATVADWVEFAARHAASAYQQGYVRGYQHVERLGPDWADPDEAAAFIEQANAEPKYNPAIVVPVEGVSQEYAARHVLEVSNAYADASGQRRGPRR